MSYFLSIFVLFVSFQALSDSSCKDQKKLLKKTCSFKKEKIKSKNTASLNSCKKIKDLFLDLKIKTKESYELCQKAYEKCTENCNRCNKSLVSKFKKKSEKNLKKIKKGFKKASKCLSQLSSDFEEKKSFIDQSDHKKILEFLKKEDLRKIKEEKRRHEEYLKNEKENRIIREKLNKTSKKVFERQALSDWARKHKLRTYGKSTKEIKKMKVDYEIKQIKKEGRKERLKIEKQRRERLKKKFEAELLKTHPPKTKTAMAIEAVKETFSSYWNDAKKVFGEVTYFFFSKIQGAYAYEVSCNSAVTDFKYGKLSDLVYNLIANPNDCFYLKIIAEHLSKEKNPFKLFLKGVSLGLTIIELLDHVYSPEYDICRLQEPIQKLIEEYNEIDGLNADLYFLGTKNNNIYHIFSYFYTFKNRAIIPERIQVVLSRYDESARYLDTTEGEGTLSYLINYTLYLIRNNINLNLSHNSNKYNHLFYEENDYKTALSIAVDEVTKAAEYYFLFNMESYLESNNITKTNEVKKEKDRFEGEKIRYMKFYEIYIATLIKSLGARVGIRYIGSDYLTNENQIRTVALKKIDNVLQLINEYKNIVNYKSSDTIEKSLKHIRSCFNQ